MSTFDFTGARRRRRQIDVFARRHGARPLRVGPHDDGHGSRRCPASRPARPRTGGRRRRRLLLRRPALLPPHITFSTASATAITFRSSQFPGEAPQIPEPLAALAPLEVAARARVHPRRLVAFPTNVLVLLRDDGAASTNGRHGRGRRWGCRLLARYRFLWSALTTHDHCHGRVALSGRRRSRDWWSSTSIRTRLPSAHDAMSRPACFGSRVVHERIVRGSFAPEYPVERWNIRHLYGGRNGTSHR